MRISLFYIFITVKSSILNATKKKRKSEVGKEMENANMFSSKKGEAKIKKKAETGDPKNFLLPAFALNINSNYSYINYVT